MKNLTLSLLLTTAPLFAGVEAPIMAPPAPDCNAGFTLGLEALYLRTYQSEGAYDDGDYEFGGRGSLGYDFNDCLFVKLTYFGYNADVSSDESQQGSFLVSEDAELEVSYLDLVVGQHFKPSDKLTLSPYVGLRWATFEESTHISETNAPKDLTAQQILGDRDQEAEFSGLGVVVGIDGTRLLGGGFSLYGTAKQAVVFGESEHSSDGPTARAAASLDLDSGDFSDDRVVYITELGLGVQYDINFGSVAANVRAGVEGQWWSGLSDDDSENAGLAGFVLGANFNF